MKNIEVLENSFEQFFKKVRSDYSQLSKVNNISISQSVILEILGKKGPKTISELAERLDITLSAVTSLSDKLIKSHYVKRERCKDDRRIVRLVLTNDGKELSVKIQNERKQLIQKLHSNLSEKELTFLVQLYQKMIQNKM